MIWQWFRRELTSSSLLVVCLSLILAFATAFSLGNLNDRIMQGLGQQNREYLTGDRVLRASYPIAEAWLTYAKDQGLAVSTQLSFSTMVFYNEQLQLTDIKAVDNAYPLYGELITEPAYQPLQTGQIIVDEKLLLLLNANIGDSIEVGDSEFIITGLLQQEPDARFNPFQTAPRALIRLDDSSKTGAIQPGSRLTYRYMFKSDDVSGSSFAIENSALTNLDAFIKPQLRPDQRWIDLSDSGNNAVNQVLDRAKLFLILSSVLVLALATTAIIVAMNYYSRSRYDLIAILKTLGAKRGKLTKLIVGQWLIILFMAILIGSLLGLGLETLLFYLLKDVLPDDLPVATLIPWFNSIALLLVISTVIGMRPYLQLLSTPPIRVLRHDSIIIRWPLRYYLPLSSFILIGLLVMLVGLNTIWWSLLLGIVVLAILLGVIGWGGLFLLRHVTLSNLAVRLAINRLLRAPLSTLSQFATFSLSLMLLTLLVMVRGGLLESWQASIPQDSPNYYILNIAPEQYDDVETFFKQNNIELSHTFPIVRARLTEINAQPTKDLIAEGSSGYGTANRELNLTWYDEPQPYNEVVAGHWPPQQGEVSVSEQQAKELNVTLGDELTFIGNAVPFTAKITSLRKVEWETMQPNFVFMFDKSTLANQPQYGFTSFRYQNDPKLLTEFNRQYPMIMIMDIGNILSQITALLAQITQTLELIVILVLSCGALLLIAQLQVGIQQRQQELKVYRILGAKLRLLQATLWIEFFTLGMISGLIAVLGAEIALFSLQTLVFNFPWQPNLYAWLLVPLISGTVFSVIGAILGIRLLKAKLTR